MYSTEAKYLGVHWERVLLVDRESTRVPAASARAADHRARPRRTAPASMCAGGRVGLRRRSIWRAHRVTRPDEKQGARRRGQEEGDEREDDEVSQVNTGDGPGRATGRRSGGGGGHFAKWV